MAGPDWLSPEARRIWEEVEPVLLAGGAYDAALDSWLLAVYCDTRALLARTLAESVTAESVEKARVLARLAAELAGDVRELADELLLPGDGRP